MKLFLFIILIFIVIAGFFSCATPDHEKCEYYCPKGAIPPIGCQCLEDIKFPDPIGR